VVLGLAARVQAQAVDQGDAVAGVWTTKGGDSEVKIHRDGGKFFGEIISLKEPNWPADDVGGMAGKPKNDRNNPDQTLRNRPVVGIRLMENFIYEGRNKWDGGRIYDPDCGKTYKCKMALVDTNQLEVHGYVGISLLGRTEVWTRQGK
jgi:uncharacterized protein (DUF2147 family)